MRAVMSLVFALALMTKALAAEDKPFSFVPRNGVVPDKETAIRIAEAVLLPIYGRQVVESEKPLQAELKGEVWVVQGTLKTSLGGVGTVEIQKRDGRIQRISHDK